MISTSRVHGSMPQMSRVMMSSGAVETILLGFLQGVGGTRGKVQHSRCDYVDLYL